MKPKQGRSRLVICAVALGATLCTGMAIGILYAYRHPLEVQIQGVCRVEFPEFLIPSAS